MKHIFYGVVLLGAFSTATVGAEVYHCPTAAAVLGADHKLDGSILVDGEVQWKVFLGGRMQKERFHLLRAHVAQGTKDSRLYCFYGNNKEFDLNSTQLIAELKEKQCHFTAAEKDHENLDAMPCKDPTDCPITCE